MGLEKLMKSVLKYLERRNTPSLKWGLPKILICEKKDPISMWVIFFKKKNYF
jgi:hypothetical protein